MKYTRPITFLLPLLMLCTACSVQPESPADSEPTANPETTSSVSASTNQTSATVFSAATVTSAAESAFETSAGILSETLPSETNLPDPNTVQATFLGVSGLGNIHISDAASFTYRFDINGQEQRLRLATGEAQGYAIQNQLKENYHYDLTLDGDTVISAKETEANLSDYTPPVSGTPGKQTLCNFLKLAMQPVGTALYVYGGGWNWEDNGSSIQTRSIGISPDWGRFFREQNASFNYRNYYPDGEFNEYYYAGLDCSGYVGWAVYNLFHTENGGEGYVGKATAMAKRFAGYGWGDWTQNVPIPDGTPATAMRPGDIMSMNNHVWISLGTCSDGSIVIAHSTCSNSNAGQPGGGVQISAIGYSVNCEAYQLASQYMNTYFPEWCTRYPTALESPGRYLDISNETSGRFRWSETALADPDGIRSMTAAEVLKLLFG